MRIADLADKRVALWGVGREGRASITALRRRLPQLPLALYCTADEVDAARRFDNALVVYGSEPDAVTLSAYDVLIKSPGVSAYKPAVLTAQAQGTQFTSGTALWFGENPNARVVAITGTKGKSTTSALLAHLARELGVRTALAGNIGLPLLELLDQSADLWVIELSSFQTGQAGPVELGVVTSLYEEHIDWHGSAEHYVADKLKLADVARQLLANATQPRLMTLTEAHPHRMTFGGKDGWNVKDGFIRRSDQNVFSIDQLAAPGAHNALNACAALAALQALGMDARAAAPALASFQPLPHRLQPLGEKHGVDWINDSIGTTPQAVIAALQSLRSRNVTVLVGGYDRGVDWSAFVDYAKAQPPRAIVCMGANGPRIEAALRAGQIACPIVRVADLATAVDEARSKTPAGGVILMSPGAPSFDQFTDYAARGRRFAELAGFEAAASGGIEGLGIA